VRTALFENWVNLEKIKILRAWSVLTSPKICTREPIRFSSHNVRTGIGRFSQKSENRPTLERTGGRRGRGQKGKRVTKGQTEKVSSKTEEWEGKRMKKGCRRNLILEKG